MSSSRRAPGTALALLALAVPAVLVSAPAAALDVEEGYPRVGSVRESQLGYEIAWGRTSAVSQLFAVHTGPGAEPELFAYCIEVTVHPGYEERMDIGGWDSFPGDNRFADEPRVREQVAWIVSNSYPQQSLDAAAAAAGLAGLTEREAITGTQVAIWQLTDSAPAPAGFAYRGLVTPNGVDTTSPAAQRVQSLVDHLTGPANVGLGESSRPALRMTPEQLAGEAGGLVGPFTIAASAGALTLDTPSGYPVVTADGAPIDPAAPPRDTALYLDVPADAPAGIATLRAELVGEGYDGLLLTSPTTPRRQTMMIADGRESLISADIELTWTAARPGIPATPIEPGAPVEPGTPLEPATPIEAGTPGTPADPAAPTVPAAASPATVANDATPTLARTGADAGPPLLGALAVLVSGAALLTLRSRRRQLRAAHHRPLPRSAGRR
nr:hypothetical protein GCM10017583_06900 [Agromyces mediolanus]